MQLIKVDVARRDHIAGTNPTRTKLLLPHCMFRGFTFLLNDIKFEIHRSTLFHKRIMTKLYSGI